MPIPPPVIDACRVLKFAHVDKTVAYTDRINIGVDGVRLGQVPNLAISRSYGEKDDVLLQFCDATWKCLAVAPCSSVDAAEAKAERGYTGIGKLWNKHPANESEVAEFLSDTYEVDPEKEWWKSFCSFCGKESREVTGMLSSGKGATICFKCVKKFRKTIRQLSDG